MAIDTHLESIKRLTEQVAKFDKSIAKVSMEKEETRLIMTMPGIGHILAVTIMAEILRIEKFSVLKNWCRMQAWLLHATTALESNGLEASPGVAHHGSVLPWWRPPS